MTANYNFCGIIVGKAGSGKTYLARSMVFNHLREHPTGIVIAHDPVRQFVADGSTWYASANAFRAAMAAAATEKKPVARVSSIGGKAGDLTVLALELGDKCRNTSVSVKVPILLVFDEGSLHDERTHISDANNELIATRRHRGVGVLLLCQRPGQLVTAFWEMCTDAFVFQLREKHVAKLAENLDVNEEEIAAVCTLEKYKHLHIRNAEGVVQGDA